MRSAKPAPSKPKLPLAVSNPEKFFRPNEGYTKLDLVRLVFEGRGSETAQRELKV